MNASPVVGVVMGSKSDYEVLLPCLDLLREFAIPHEARIVSAHRTPDWLFQYAEQAEPRGLKIIIAGCRRRGAFAGNAGRQDDCSRCWRCPFPPLACRGLILCFPLCRCRRGFRSPPWLSANRAPPMRRCWRWPSWLATIRSWETGSAPGARHAAQEVLEAELPG